ncbi:carboxymuconolactone decarboxylase family protein [Endothiovibrio diazotrophicus]
MAHITLPEYEEMPPRVQERARPIMEKTGQLGEIFRLMAVREDIYFATDGMVQTLLLAETELPFTTKERIALLISLENSCKMCVDVHKGIAKMLGMSDEQIAEALEGIDAIQCEPGEKTLLRFCVRASAKDNYKVRQAEIDAVREAGYRETQIVEAVAITGYFNYINTLSNVFGLGRDSAA